MPVCLPGLDFSFLAPGLVQKRVGILREHVLRHGGRVLDQATSPRNATNSTPLLVIVAESLEPSQIRKFVEESKILSACATSRPLVIVRATWISRCVMARSLAERGDYEVTLPKKRVREESGPPAKSQRSVNATSPNKPSQLDPVSL
jgi:hypothetical protein